MMTDYKQHKKDKKGKEDRPPFVWAVRQCFAKYNDFTGRAGRPEFWYWFLFTFICALLASLLDAALFNIKTVGPVYFLLIAIIFIPNLAVTARRLHDTGRSGWWQLAYPLILLAIWLAGDIIMDIAAWAGYDGVRNAIIIVILGSSLIISISYLSWLIGPGMAGDNHYGRDPSRHNDNSNGNNIGNSDGR